MNQKTSSVSVSSARCIISVATTATWHKTAQAPLTFIAQTARRADLSPISLPSPSPPSAVDTFAHTFAQTFARALLPLGPFQP